MSAATAATRMDNTLPPTKSMAPGALDAGPRQLSPGPPDSKALDAEAPDAEPFSKRQIVRVCSVAIAAVTVSSVILGLSVVRGSRGLGLAGLALAACLAWVLLGVPALRRGAPAKANGYLAVLTVVLGAAVATSPNAAGALFVVQPQVWLLATTVRSGVCWSVTATAVTAAAALSTGRVDPVQLGWVMVATLAYGLLLGTWITRTRQRSAERAALITALRQAQTQVARMSHQEGVVAERERMSRDIHDTLAQGFLSIMAQARAAVAEARALPTTVGAPAVSGPPGSRTAQGAPGAAGAPDVSSVVGRLQQIEATARENLSEARTLVTVMAPPGLHDDGLPATVTRLADRFAAASGIRIDTDIPAPARLTGLSPASQVVVIRAAQEVLANIRKHAHATHVRIDLRRSAYDTLILTVSDDGVGMPAAPTETTGAGGYGLAGLRDRVALVGGRVAVDSTAGHGTTVAVELPILAQEQP